MYNEIDLSQYGIDTRSNPIEVAESRLYRGANSDGEPLAIKTFPALQIEQIVEYTDTTNWLASVINSESEFLKEP